MQSQTIQSIKDRRYIQDIVHGMVPSDQEFDAIMARLAESHVDDVDKLWMRSTTDIARLADDIRAIRAARNS